MSSSKATLMGFISSNVLGLNNMYINKETFEITSSFDDGSFQVDDLIAELIQTLNIKGYRTAFCCSGHHDSGYIPERAYIEFQFGGITPEYLPDGWCWEHDGHMEFEYAASNEEDLRKEIFTTMDKAKQWADTLPSAK